MLEYLQSVSEPVPLEQVSVKKNQITFVNSQYIYKCIIYNSKWFCTFFFTFSNIFKGGRPLYEFYRFIVCK